MKHCPNTECPGRKHSRSPEYVDEIDVCADCGAELVEGEAPEDDPAQAIQGASLPKHLIRRIGVTLAAVAAAVIGTRIPMPSLHQLEVPSHLAEAVSGPNVSVIALGVVPFVSACSVVELVSLLRNKWRIQRVSGAKGRRGIDRAALLLSVPFAFFQAFGLAMYLEGVAGHMGWAWRLGVCLSLTAGTCLLVGIARWVSHAGLGNGIAVLLVAELLSSWATTASKPSS